MAHILRQSHAGISRLAELVYQLDKVGDPPYRCRLESLRHQVRIRRHLQ